MFTERTGFTAAIAGMVGIVVTKLVDIFLVRRHEGGNIKTTDAEELWRQSSELQNRLTAEVDRRVGEIERLDKRLDEALEANRVLCGENTRLRKERDQLRRSYDNAMKRIETLERRLDEMLGTSPKAKAAPA